jgi:hypothetical protein
LDLNRPGVTLVSGLVGAHALDRARVENALAGAALRAGLSEAEARPTIQSGLDAGAAEPRDLSNIGQNGGGDGPAEGPPSDETGLTVTFQETGRNGTGRLTAKIGDRTVFADQVNIVKTAERSKFVENLKQVHPDCDSPKLQAQEPVAQPSATGTFGRS